MCAERKQPLNLAANIEQATVCSCPPAIDINSNNYICSNLSYYQAQKAYYEELLHRHTHQHKSREQRAKVNEKKKYIIKLNLQKTPREKTFPFLTFRLRYLIVKEKERKGKSLSKEDTKIFTKERTTLSLNFFPKAQ